MNWRTTAVLFVILIALGLFVFFQMRGEDEADLMPTAAPSTFVETVALFEDVAIDDVVRLEITRASASTESGRDSAIFTQEEGDWFMTVPTATQVISSSVASPLTSLLNSSTRRTLPASETEGSLADYGLDEPSARVTVAAQREGQVVRYELEVGDQTPNEDGYYIQRSGDPRVHIVGTFPLGSILELVDNPPPVVSLPTPAVSPPLTGTVPLSEPGSP